MTRGLLPENWETEFIGYEQGPWDGDHLDQSVITLRGSGRDIGERGQGIGNLQYASSTAKKDTLLTSRLLSMEGKTRQPLARNMLRENRDTHARAMSLLYSPKQGLRIFSREQAGGETKFSKPLKLELPFRLKLEPVGDLFSASASPDGEEWTSFGEAVSVRMAKVITGGLAITAGKCDGSRH
ncbi:MAG: hypothetical protein ACI9NQ_001820 [Paracoccaceae bacterium]|jgi:hypothetical protein